MANGQLMPKHPLAEVFGFKINDKSKEAKRHRAEKLCPYNNGVPRCTKASKDNPIGVCCLNHGSNITIICPVRFREKWKVCQDAVNFFFPQNVLWTPLKEIRLKDKYGESAGNIDLIIVAHDVNGKILDFGAVEVQAVYVSGNISRPFEHYMLNPDTLGEMDWSKETNYPRPDYLSSSRKRLVPQLLYKGRILHAWGKKQAVVVDSPFFETLPNLPQCEEKDSDLCWLIYGVNEGKIGRLELELEKKVFTGFDPTMKKLGTPEVGELNEFINSLEKKLAPELENLRNNFGVNSFSELLARNQKGSSPSLLADTSP